MRIAELVNNLEIGGAERMVVDLARGLKVRGHEVTIFCLRAAGPLLEPALNGGIEVIALNKRSALSVHAVTSMARSLRERRIDVVLTHNPLVHHYGTAAARIARVPAVVNTFHGPGNLAGFGKTQAIFDITCLASDRVVACCEAVGAHLRRVTTVAKRQLAVIPNGIPLEKFTSISPSRQRKGTVFGAVGRLAAVKDHGTLLRAFALAAESLPDITLELLGDGPLMGALKANAQGLGIRDKVVFHGATLDVAAFLAHIDVFAVTSLSEGLPLTLIEAMAAGLPVVATAVGAIPEIVSEAGNGWLCNPGEPDELAQALLSAARCDSRRERGLRGRRYAMQHNSAEVMTKAYETLFELILADKRVPSSQVLPEKLIQK
jgi:glycosyltransferase involved in cell wall biosynthesis